MRLVAWLRSLWRGLTSRARVEAEMDEELRHHLELRARDLLATGLSPDDAARRARLELGGIDGVKESARAARGLRVFDEIMADVRYGARALRRNPGFALVAVLTLALGIGANTAIFSALDAVLLRPLPFADPDRLVSLDEINIPWSLEDEPREKSMPDILDARALEDVFTHVAAYAPGGLNLTGAGAPRRIRVGVVTTNLFEALGIPPRRGRTFMPDEGDPGAGRVAVVSDGFWRTHFGGVDDVTGASIALNGTRYEVVGVMPPGFAYPDHAEVWLPLSIPLTSATLEPFRQYLPSRMIARLAPGVSIEQARARVYALWAQYERPDSPRQVTAAELVQPLRPTLVGERRTVLLVLLGATALVLLVACVNVANLLLSRSAARRQELAVRATLGATPARMARQLLVESLLLACVGGVLGVALGLAGVRFLDVLVPGPLAGAAPIRIDARVLGFTLVVTAAAGLAFGILPAFVARRSDAGATLRSSAANVSGGGRSNRVRRALVTAEVALATMLVIGSALMLRSLHALLTTDAGIEPERVATLELTLAPADYPTTVAQRQFYEAVVARLTATPRVDAAGVINELPLRGEGGVRFLVYPEDGRPPEFDLAHTAQDLRVTAGYFEAMAIPILVGRAPRPRPDTLQPREVAINRALGDVYWPGANPIGQQLEVPTGQTFEIVGVVANVRVWLDQEPYAQAYYSLLDTPYNNAAIVARGRLPTGELARTIESAVHAVAPQQAVYNVRTMEQVIAGAITPRRTNTMLITSFGLLALALATIGVYGVISLSVARRTKEIGIRIALGARPASVRRVVMREALLLALIGVTLGTLGSWWLSDALSSLIYGITTRDAIAFTVAPITLLVASAIAALSPAQRATRVDPLLAIRAE